MSDSVIILFLSNDRNEVGSVYDKSENQSLLVLVGDTSPLLSTLFDTTNSSLQPLFAAITSWHNYANNREGKT